MSALTDEILAALETPRGRTLIRSALVDVAREVIIPELLAALQRPSEWIGQADLARHLGLTPKALSARLARGSTLASLAVVDDAGRRRWRRADVDAWMQANARGGGK